ncbi:MAG: peptidyl-alpha-hydroxyglycine alpha-amidating lyase family protein [Gammaproteobacteria bacterium]|nr:peptidyl-alpha-hydroxyglycine alpha-amidating lyase family protein [Gammaproteobacteria bacterium]
MSSASRTGSVTTLAAAIAALAASPAVAQNHAPNPYNTLEDFAPLPDGRSWGSTSAVEVSPDGETIWAIDRCGANSCDTDVPGASALDIVFEFDKDGNILRRWGAGDFVWPHGIDLDAAGNVWVADARGNEAGTNGHTAEKFSPDGELLMTLGRPGVAGRTRDTFDQPNDVLIAPDGSIFVADGHPANGNNRIVKFSADGDYILEWGETGSEPGQFRTPHALAMDSEGLLYVGDRSNRRVQVFDQEGGFVRDIYNVGRASGLTIDEFDRLYVADSESNYSRNPGFGRGIRVINIADFRVIAYIPDPEPDPDNAGTSAAEGVAVDNEGNVYGAEVGPRQLVKHALPGGVVR